MCHRFARRRSITRWLPRIQPGFTKRILIHGMEGLRRDDFLLEAWVQAKFIPSMLGFPRSMKLWWSQDFRLFAPLENIVLPHGFDADPFGERSCGIGAGATAGSKCRRDPSKQQTIAPKGMSRAINGATMALDHFFLGPRSGALLTASGAIGWAWLLLAPAGLMLRLMILLGNPNFY